MVSLSQQGPASVASVGAVTPSRRSVSETSNMGRIFTVQGGSTDTGGEAFSAAKNARKARIHMRSRRPFPAAAAQQSGPAAR